MRPTGSKTYVESTIHYGRRLLLVRTDRCTVSVSKWVVSTYLADDTRSGYGLESLFLFLFRVKGGNSSCDGSPPLFVFLSMWSYTFTILVLRHSTPLCLLLEWGRPPRPLPCHLSVVNRSRVSFVFLTGLFLLTPLCEVQLHRCQIPGIGSSTTRYSDLFSRLGLTLPETYRTKVQTWVRTSVTPRLVPKIRSLTVLV